MVFEVSTPSSAIDAPGVCAPLHLVSTQATDLEPMSYPVLRINLSLFVEGRRDLTNQLNTVIKVIVADPQMNQIFATVLNYLQGFKIYLVDKTHPLSQQHLPLIDADSAVGAAYLAKQRFIVISASSLEKYTKHKQLDILNTLRHEFTHAFWDMKYRMSLTRMGRVIYGTDTVKIPLSQKSAKENCQTIKQRLQAYAKEISLVGNEPKYTKKFNALYTKNKADWKKQGYFITEATPENLSELFGKTFANMKDGETLRFPGTTAIATFYKTSSQTGSLKLPMFYKTAMYVMLSIERTVARHYPPEEDSWRYLSELQAWLQGALPQEILALYLPEFMEAIDKADEKHELNTPIHLGGYSGKISEQALLDENALYFYSPYQILSLIRTVSLFPDNYNQSFIARYVMQEESMIAKSLRLLEQFIQSGKHTKIAHLYSARLTLHQKSLNKAVTHFKQVFAQLEQLPNEIVFSDFFAYIDALSDLAKRENQTKYLHDAAVLLRKFDKIFKNYKSRRDAALLTSKVETTKQVIQAYRKAGIMD